MKFVLGIVFFLLFSSIAYRAEAQIDSLGTIKPSISSKPTLILNTDFRQTIVRSTSILVYGGFAGIHLYDKDLYTIGYYGLTNSAKIKFKAQNQSQPILANENVSLWFLSAGYTRTVYNGKFLTIDIPLEAGFGEGSSGLNDTDGKLLRLTNSKIYPIQGGVSTNIKLTRWFGIHLQAGYREMIGKTVLQNQYSGLYYSYGLSLNFGTICKDLKIKK
jgi:hypothetical protein